MASEKQPEKPLTITKEQAAELEKLQKITLETVKQELESKGSQEKPLEILLRKYLEILDTFVAGFGSDLTEKLSIEESEDILQETYDKLSKNLEKYGQELGLRTFLTSIKDLQITRIEESALKGGYKQHPDINKRPKQEIIVDTLQEHLDYLDLGQLIILDTFETAKYSRLPQRSLETLISQYCDIINTKEGRKRYDQFKSFIEKNFGSYYLVKFFKKLIPAINASNKDFFKKIMKDRTECERISSGTSNNVIHFDQERGLIQVWKIVKGKRVLLDTFPGRGGPRKPTEEQKKEDYDPTPDGHFWVFNSGEHVSTRYQDSWIPYGATIRLTNNKGKPLSQAEEKNITTKAKQIIKKRYPTLLKELFENQEEETELFERCHELEKKLRALAEKYKGKEPTKGDDKIIQATIEQIEKVMEEYRVKQLEELHKKEGIQIQYFYSPKYKTKKTKEKEGWYFATGPKATFFNLGQTPFMPNKQKKDKIATIHTRASNYKPFRLINFIVADTKTDTETDETTTEIEIMPTWTKHDYGPMVVKIAEKTEKGYKVINEFFHSYAGREHDLIKLGDSHGCIRMNRDDTIRLGDKYTKQGTLVIITSTAQQKKQYFDQIHSGTLQLDRKNLFVEKS